MKSAAVIRASDDFWPRDPASHTIHIASVAYNTVFLGEFMQPDWDMFHVCEIQLLLILYVKFPNILEIVSCSLRVVSNDRAYTQWLNTMEQLVQWEAVQSMSGAHINHVYSVYVTMLKVLKIGDKISVHIMQ